MLIVYKVNVNCSFELFQGRFLHLGAMHYGTALSTTYSVTTWIRSSVFQSVLAGKGYNDQVQLANKTLELVLLLNFCPPLWLDPDLKNLTLKQRASETQDMQKHLCPSCCPRQYTNSDLHCFFGLTFDKGELRYCGMQRGWTWFKTAVPCTQRVSTDAAQQRIEQTPVYQ